MSIRPIDASSVRRITAGQVILDLRTAVKELIENSLDAGATSVEIRFKDHGLESIEVIDNGSGIDSKDFAFIARRSHTSKLTDFAALDHVTTFGFRGEALASLCALSKVTLVTATEATAPKGSTLSLSGRCKIETASGLLVRSVARQRGTTITVTDLFAQLPVRRRHFEKNAKREFGHAQELLQAYALISVGVKVVVSNTTASGTKSIQIQTANSRTLRDTFTSLFGSKPLANLVDLDLSFSFMPPRSSQRLRATNDMADSILVRVRGLISRPGHGRTAGDRQYLYLNGRPFDAGKLTRAINDVYKSCGSASSYPVIVADFSLPTDTYDLNLSPDKRTIFLHSEQAFTDALKDSLRAFFDRYQGVYALKQAKDTPTPSPTKSQPLAAYAARQITPAQLSGNISIPSSQSIRDRLSRMASEEIDESPPDSVQSSSPSARSPSEAESYAEEAHPFAMQHLSNQPRSRSSLGRKGIRLGDAATGTPMLMQTKLPFRRTRSGSVSVREPHEMASKRARIASFSPEEEPELAIRSTASDYNDEEIISMETPPAAPLGQEPVIHSESAGSKPAADVVLEDVIYIDDVDAQTELMREFESLKAAHVVKVSCQLVDMRKKRVRRARDALADLQGSHDDAMAGAAIDADAIRAEASLTRTVAQEDFSRMQILGQFNLGFIIVRRSERSQDDIFIIDQHASDEKYNFERLQAHTKMQSQRLLAPRLLHWTASDELLAIEHEEILRANGFEIAVEREARVGQRVKLIAQPMSQKTTFGVPELEELLFLLRENGGRTMVRPTKTRKMFAMRACRSSVMIGTALSKQQMTSIIRHMGTMQEPWNCPHGRPTMRFLAHVPGPRIKMRHLTLEELDSL
ncbi:uncharacterized protein L969DRAFT_80078 [Mixia osmundae IAM 14324]|uniref:DNA mismatch repair protein S5 domain-containing protein n=1 Tax=Mixia osmundae (strain CBS 9802 / IAM 14324 / JCM 22182 / KY 12970) TaxID=764103 RepID=G7EB59_MIXOS|nr:uncharacterized protein L969DRAFT_80078 [Mixia osmundae IAM 14324]KEI36563.1 hypothetical protein L969DRAFT_80078 [Mixia osmundae IAM 14324]GAB00070.1 hypothetical protein E5Q_06772 [Mixia osmundae IAM 14324]